MRPHLLQLRLVSRVSIVLGDQIDELAVAVVLGHGSRTMLIDAARNLAVVVLVVREPVDEILDVLIVAESEQSRRGQRAIANPRARVAPRAGLNRRPITVDQNVGELGAQRLGVARRRRRERDARWPHLLSPFGRHLLELRRDGALSLSRQQRESRRISGGGLRSSARSRCNHCGRRRDVPATRCGKELIDV